jgi:hypothetical protein
MRRGKGKKRSGEMEDAGEGVREAEVTGSGFRISSDGSLVKKEGM